MSYLYIDMNTSMEIKDFDSNKKHFRNKPKPPPKQQIHEISRVYLYAPRDRYSEFEMEAKFGTKGIKPITKLDYDNVVKKLKSLNYTTENEKGSYFLKIQPEALDVKTGEFKTSNDIERFRVEISGLSVIQEYCKTDSIQKILTDFAPNANIMRKLDVKVGEQYIDSADFNDFNFRVTLKNENTVGKTGKIAQELTEKWNNTKKVFRFMNRVTFKHPSLPFKVELSIVRSSTKNDHGYMTQTYNIEDSNVFQNPEIYEIEVEALPEARLSNKKPEELSGEIQKVIKDVLCGLQKTNYPISYVEQKEVLQHYHKLLFEEEYIKKSEQYVPKERFYSSDFIGPGQVTLGIQNIGLSSANAIVPNITEPYSYCVTEKADGDRHLMYVDSKGKMYLINMNMNVIFTGAKTTEEKCFNSLLDGELILHNKLGQFINTFAAFDIYYVNKIDVRARPFIQVDAKEKHYFKNGCRLPMLKDFIKILKAHKIDTQNSNSVNNKSPIIVVSKNFYPSMDEQTNFSKFSIFEANNYLLRRIADNLFDYEIDGLIFTPTLYGVGGNKIAEAGPKKKITWAYNFKWKPSEATNTFPKSYNTIDFMVVTKKGGDGNDIVTPVFENGINANDTTQHKQYKTLILTVGFDPSKHGYINPCQDVLEDKFLISNSNDDNDEGYKLKQFYPSNPYDPLAGLCNVMLEMDATGEMQMFTEEREVFDDQTVVEFRYDMSKPGLWKWVPMRVRYDKTADFRAKNGVGANDYKTADNNWSSIYNPVTEKMIGTGEDIPTIEVADDVYYNSITDDKLTQQMRDFHNLYVKKALIQGVSKKGNTLIDFSCGKAGDLPKWISADLSFVLGIDISKDNIENRLNGACARYLNYRKTTKTMPYALFVNGNSSLNIRSGTNLFSDKANEIVKSIFGSGGINSSLGPAVERQYGKGTNGFDVSSCQFSLHYMFENKKTFYNFIRNVAECTKLNGYFIATCYDGKTIFNVLKKKNEGESKEIYIDEKKIWSITKLYDANTFEDNENSLGLKVDVYQDSINQTISEYLVNFEFLTSTMDKYGFTLLSREDAKHMKLPEGSGMFSELYSSMMNELNRNPKKSNDYKNAPNMHNYEKEISFLNRFFIYKKISTRNAEKLTKSLLGQLPDAIEFEQDETILAQEAVKKAEAVVKTKTKKLQSKLKLEEATEALEDAFEGASKTEASKTEASKTEASKTEASKTEAIKEVKEVEINNEIKEGQNFEFIPKTKKNTTRKKDKKVAFNIEEK